MNLIRTDAMDNSSTSVSAEDDNTKKADEPDSAPELKNLS